MADQVELRGILVSTTPQVSVIIIFYNAASYLAEAIESVLAQTYSSWELLLVDDGSSDGSTAIARQYTADFPHKMRYFEHAHHENHGMSASRNVGISHARGVYVAFLDADDVWLPQKLAAQVPILEAHHNAVMVYGATRYWYSWTGNAEDMNRDYLYHPRIRPNTLVQPPDLLRSYLTNQAAVPCMCSLLVRRSILQQIGGFEEVFRGLYEDQVFYAKICLAGAVFVTDECWENYRQHPQSSCAVAARTGTLVAAQAAYLKWLTIYLVQQNIQDAALWQALRKAIWHSRHPFVTRLLRYVRHRVRWLQTFMTRPGTSTLT